MSTQGSPPPGRSGDADRVVVRFTGDLDLSTESELREALARPLADDPIPALLILDLGGDGFCSVRGLALIIDATEAAAALGVELVVTRPRASLLRALHVLGWENRIRLASGDVAAPAIGSALIPGSPDRPDPSLSGPMWSNSADRP